MTTARGQRLLVVPDTGTERNAWVLFADTLDAAMGPEVWVRIEHINPTVASQAIKEVRVTAAVGCVQTVLEFFGVPSEADEDLDNGLIWYPGPADALASVIVRPQSGHEYVAATNIYVRILAGVA